MGWVPGPSSLQGQPQPTSLILHLTLELKLDIKPGPRHSSSKKRHLYVLLEHGLLELLTHSGGSSSHKGSNTFQRTLQCLSRKDTELGIKCFHIRYWNVYCVPHSQCTRLRPCWWLLESICLCTTTCQRKELHSMIQHLVL